VDKQSGIGFMSVMSIQHPQYSVPLFNFRAIAV
jgi:hypothetical protein